MKKHILPSLAVAIAAVLATCGCANNEEVKDYRVEIATPFGTMKARLYDDTPLHRDNFMNLVRSGAYDSLLFHRVIRSFMIQGGDPDSRHARKNAELGNNSIGPDIPAEIVYPAHFHKRGALAAARQSDSVNPERKSSGSQFYIVQGRQHREQELSECETIHNNKIRSRIYKEIMKFYADSLQMLQDAGDAEALSEMQFRIVERVEQIGIERGEIVSMPENVRDVYREFGGTQHLDMEYTVFGEVYEGLEVIDSIASVAVTPPRMRPGMDIWMVIREIKK